MPHTTGETSSPSPGKVCPFLTWVAGFRLAPFSSETSSSPLAGLGPRKFKEGLSAGSQRQRPREPRATSSLPGHAGGEGSATCLGGRWSRAGGATASRAHSAPRGRLERSQMSLGWNERLSRRQGRRTFQKCSFVKGRESDSNEAGETLCWCCCLKPRAGCRGRAVLPRPAHVIRSHPACLEEKRRRPER